MKKLFTLFAALLATGYAMADTETSAAGEKNVDCTGTSFTVPGTCIAGGAKLIGSSSNDAIKLRTGVTLSDGSSQGFMLNVTEEYTINSIKLVCCNNGTGESTVMQHVYVDEDFTSDKLSEEVTLSSTANSTIELSDLSATKVVEFVCDNGKQLRGAFTVTYTKPDKTIGEITLSASTATMEIEGSSDVTYTYNGDGEVTVSSSDENVATVSVSGNTVTVSALAIGNTTITVSSAATSTCTAAATTLEVAVPYTPETATTYASFNNGLSGDLDVTIADEKVNYNAAYTGTFNGTSYTQGLKIQTDPDITFTTTAEATITIVQSTATNGGVCTKFDDVVIVNDYGTSTYFYADLDNNVRIFTIKNVAAGEHTVGRSSEWGLLYIGVTYAEEPTAIESIEAVKAEEGAAYNLAGQKVGENYKGIVIKNGKKFIQK